MAEAKAAGARKKAPAKEKDLLERLAARGGEALHELDRLPGAKTALRTASDMRERVEDLQKRVMGIEALEKRLAKLERRVAELEKHDKAAAPARPRRTSSPAR